MTEQMARHAVPSQRDTLARVLTEAFLADPMMALLFPDPDDASLSDHPRLEKMMKLEVDRHLSAGHCYIVDDVGAALWTPPGVDAPSEEFVALVDELAGSAHMETLLPDFIEMMQWKPDEPHFYLHMIGAADNARGMGLGTLMLRRVLDVCDRENTPAYLEASTARSAELYARHGFEELAAVHFTDTVALRPMLRLPA
jgi:GNAT superfamily N-acetyltransferase